MPPQLHTSPNQMAKSLGSRGQLKEQYSGEVDKQKYEEYRKAKQKILEATGIAEINDLL